MSTTAMRCALAFVPLIAPFGQSRADSLMPPTIGGGAFAAPVAHGHYLYAATGVTVNVWDFANPAAPVLVDRTDDTPAPGAIFGIAIVDEYLYACWSDDAQANYGLWIYSLVDPSKPAHVASAPGAPCNVMLAHGQFLYEASGTAGSLTAIDISDRLRPVVAGIGTSDMPLPSSITTFSLAADRLVVSGQGMIEESWFTIYDLRDPAHPQGVGSGSLGAFGVIAATTPDGYAIAFEDQLNVYDLRDPSHITRVFSTGPPLGDYRALVDGDVMYFLGGDTLQVWDISARAHPTFVHEVPIDTINTRKVTTTPWGAIAITLEDVGIAIDDHIPQSPSLQSTFLLPVGSSIAAGATDGRYAYLADVQFGLRIVDAATFVDVGNLPAEYPSETSVGNPYGLALAGSTLLVAGIGGAAAFDVSDAAQPRQLGNVLPLYFPFEIAAQGDRAYANQFQFAGGFVIIDASDPAHLREAGSLDGTFAQLRPRGDRVFALGIVNELDTIGLVVIDASSEVPSIEGRLTICDFLGVQALDVSADGNEAYAGCVNGSVEIIDTSEATAPTQIGEYVLPDASNAIWAVAAYGHTLYVGHVFGVDQVDITDPTAPTQVARYPTGSMVVGLSTSPDGSVLARTYGAGEYFFECSSAAEGRPLPCHETGTNAVINARGHSTHDSAQTGAP